MADEVKTGTIIKKHKILIFTDTSELNDGSAYKRIKKSTELDLVSEAQTEEFDFIASENTEEILKNYKFSLAQDLVMIQGEEDFEFFFNKFYDLPNNPEVKVKTMIVFAFKGDSSTGYKAWETTSNVMFDGMNGVDSKINFTLNFGDIATGTAKMVDSTPTFEKAGA